MVWLPSGEAYFYQLIMVLTGWVAVNWLGILAVSSLLILAAWLGDKT